MTLAETKLKGAYVVENERFADQRGFFSRLWSTTEFAAQGLYPNIAEINLSFNLKQGTLRGMHFQIAPYAQEKLVRCTRGSIYDVIIDLRPESPTFKDWVAVELSAENYRQFYIPAGFAHGFQTLTDNAEVLYLMSSPFVPESARGVRWNDPAFKIDWPPADRTIIARDNSYPDFTQ